MRRWRWLLANQYSCSEHCGSPVSFSICFSFDRNRGRNRLAPFGNGVGSMLVRGNVVRTVGNISMDMCTLDVSNIDVREGDEVIVFNDEQRIEELARQIGTIPYEILTNISQRVKRVYFYE